MSSLASPDDRQRAVRSSLEAEGLAGALPFLDAVAEQVARLEGRDPGEGECDRVAFARAHMLLAAALLARGDQDAIDAPARALAGHPAMYAAFVQNVDLLYSIRCHAADPVAFLLSAALDR